MVFILEIRVKSYRVVYITKVVIIKILCNPITY